MTLSDLAHRVGVWVETAQAIEQLGFFVGAGPSGFRPEDEETLRFVSRMQAEHQLSLATLRTVVIVEARRDLARAEQLLQALVEPDPSRAGPGPTTRSGLLAKGRAPAALVDALTAAGAVPAEGPYGGHHVWIVDAASELSETGMTATAIAQLAAHSLAIAAVEVDALIGEVGRGALPRDALAKTRGRRVAIGRLVATARAAGAADQMATVARAADGSKALTAVATHVPSPLFIARHRLDEVVVSVRAAYERERADGATTTERATAFARLLVGLGRLPEVVTVASEAVRRGEAGADLWLYLGLSRSLLGDDAGAIAAIDAGVRLAPHSPRSHAYRAAAYLVAAGRAGDLLQATVCVDTALESLDTSRRLSSQSLVEQVEADLVRGRLGVVMPAALGFGDRALDDLRAVLHATESATDEQLGYGVAGSRDLVRVTAAFFLGTALDERGDREGALRYLREVVALDPASDFAAAAYRVVHSPSTLSGGRGRLEAPAPPRMLR